MFNFKTYENTLFFSIIFAEKRTFMKSKKINHSKDSYEEYLEALFCIALSTNGKPTQSHEEILLNTTISYGRTMNVAKADMKHVLNIMKAVLLLLKRDAVIFNP